MFHKHQYKEIARTFAEPQMESLTRVYPNYFCEKLIHGLTTILWECEVCQKLRKEELLGKLQ